MATSDRMMAGVPNPTRIYSRSLMEGRRGMKYDASEDLDRGQTSHISGNWPTEWGYMYVNLLVACGRNPKVDSEHESWIALKIVEHFEIRNCRNLQPGRIGLPFP